MALPFPLPVYKKEFNEELFPDQTTENSIVKTFVAINYSPTFIRICFALLLRAGYLLIQLGSVPTENVYIILLQNIVDMVVGVTCFCLIGYMFAYGRNIIWGFIGIDLFIGSGHASYDDAIFGICAVLIGTSIITSLTSGRVHFFGYLVTTAVYSGFLIPLFMHWIWVRNGLLNRKTVFGVLMTCKDQAGGMIIHLSAGVSGLVGTLFLGRRVMLLEQIDDSSIGTESPGTTTVGYIFVNMGLIAFGLPNKRYQRYVFKFDEANESIAGMMILNNVLAIVGSTLMVVVLSFIFFRKAFHYWIIQRCMQASIVGIVSISCGPDVISPPLVFVIAAVGGAIFVGSSQLINLTFLEDYCNIISIHVVTASYSALIVALLAFAENLGYSVRFVMMLNHFTFQIISAILIAGITFGVMCLLYFLYSVIGCLRNRNEKINHRRAVQLRRNASQRGFLDRIFVINQDTSYVEPGPMGRRVHASPTNTYLSKEPSMHAASAGRHPRMRPLLTVEDEEAPKPRNPVFTIQTVRSAPFQLDSWQQNSGDFGVANANMAEGANSKRFAFSGPKRLLASEKGTYSLHRTKKRTNLAKWKPHQVKYLSEVIKKEYLPIEIDKKFNDNFITIKCAPTQATTV